MERAEAQIIFFEENQDPRQMVLDGEDIIGGGDHVERAEGKLMLDYPFLAGQQGRFFREDGHWFYENQSEEGFTSAAGTILRRGERQQLRDFSVIRIANDKMLTILFRENAAVSAEWKSIGLDDSVDHSVKIVDATDEGKPEEEQDSLILCLENGRWNIQELHSNQIYLNGERITQPVKLRIDSVLAVGDTLFFFEGSRLIYNVPEAETAPLSIFIDERAVHSHFRKQVLLKDIYLEIEPGSMVLILGGSGAGKTTFVNAVTGYEKAKAKIQSGKVDFYRDYKDVKYQIGFVPQADLLRGDDTVSATLMNAAQMRLPSGVSESEREKKVRDTLALFGLEEFAGSPVSKLSGGQRKRLSICVEYISDPSLFILDEPDSGLDGVMARELMERLKTISREGKIVMVITHQPDRAADLFDKVIVLAKGGEQRVGQLAFYGTVPQCRAFFGVNTMEQVVKSVNAVSEGGLGEADYFIAKYRKLSEEREKDRAWEELEKASSGKNPAPEKSGQEAAPVQSPDGAGTTGKKQGKSLFSRKNGTEEGPHSEEERKNGGADTAAGTSRKQAFRKRGRDGRAGDYAHTGRIGQVGIYLGKLFRLFFYEKNWKVLLMSALIAFLVSKVVGLNMFKSMEGAKIGALAFACVCIWNGFFNSIQMVCKERDILKREHRAGLHISAYMTAQVLFQAFLCALQVAIAMLIYHSQGLVFPEQGVLIRSSSMLDISVTLFLITFSADMLALMVSCLVRTTTAAMTIVPFLLMIQMLFADVAFPLHGRVAKLADVTIAKWGIRAICAQADFNSLPSNSAWNQFVNLANQSADGKALVKWMRAEGLSDQFRYQAAAALMNPAYAASASNVFLCWGIMILFAVLYIAVGVLALEFIDHDRR